MDDWMNEQINCVTNDVLQFRRKYQELLKVNKMHPLTPSYISSFSLYIKTFIYLSTHTNSFKCHPVS